jgi:hypothetical protein
MNRFRSLLTIPFAPVHFGLFGGYNETAGKVRFERIKSGTAGDTRRLWADLHFKPRGSAGFKSKANRIDGTVYESDGGARRGGMGGLGGGGGEVGWCTLPSNPKPSTLNPKP